jgi:Flp pilus assembly protein TadG
VGERGGSVQRLLRLSDGSTTLEGIVAMGVFFLLIAVVVQLGFLVIARSAVSASMEAAARRAAIPESDVPAERARLGKEIQTVVPGIKIVDTSIKRSFEDVTVRATFEWTPPGPDLIPIQFTLERAHANVVPP